MGKITSGKRKVDGTTVLLGGEGGLRKIRCPKCKNLAPAHTRSDGKVVYKCNACGTEFSQVKM